MKVYIERTKEQKIIEAGDCKELLQKLKINPTTVLIARNGQLITEQTKLNSQDEIKLISVISGG
ncbi:MoaD/ThiS family protein [Candidatus Woesearchaeota archaeon]|nr:MoaD/ThiS family protein [Candidatus Woesearchaeota archaeon]